MNVHKNARLTPQGRALLVERVRTDRWRAGDAAAAAGLSERQAFRWLARHRTGGKLALQDRSSAAALCPHHTNPDTLAAIERLRRERRTGPLIARVLAPPTTVSRRPDRDLIACECVLCFEGLVATATDRTNNSVAATLSPAEQTGCFAGRNRGPGDEPSGCHDCGVAGLAGRDP
jgi:hypothetical protein